MNQLIQLNITPHTAQEFRDAGTIFPDGGVFIIKDGDKRALYLGTGGDVDSAKKLVDQDTALELLNAEINVDRSFEVMGDRIRFMKADGETYGDWVIAPKGDKGDKGEDGIIGFTPDHEIAPGNNAIRFQKQDGNMGEWIALSQDPISTVKSFLTYKDRTSLGYIPFDFNNAISQAENPIWYAEVGDLYEAEHVAAGDSPSGVGMFYPTPIPTKYSRCAIPPVTLNSSDVDISGNYIKLGNLNKSLRTGTPFRVIGEDLPAPLVSGKVYYIRIIIEEGNNRFYLYNSEKDAIKEQNIIDLTTTGAGSIQLSQENINLSHSMQRLHGHASGIYGSQMTESEGVLQKTIYSASLGYSDPSTGADDRYGVKLDTDLDPSINSLNENRPDTGYEFKYVKIVEPPQPTITTNKKYTVSGTADIEHNLPDITEYSGEVTIKRTGSGSGKILFPGTSFTLAGESMVTLAVIDGKWEEKHFKRYEKHYIGDKVVFENGWSNYENSYCEVFYTVKDRKVSLSGLLKAGSPLTTMFTIPEGLRPSGRMIFHVPVRVDVYSSGEVKVNDDESIPWLSLNGISWDIE